MAVATPSYVGQRVAALEAEEAAAPGSGPGWMRAALLGLVAVVLVWTIASAVDLLVRQGALDQVAGVDVQASAALTSVATGLSEADQLAAATLLGGGSATSDQARAVRSEIEGAMLALQRVDVTRADLRGLVQQAQQQITGYSTAVNSALDAQRLGPSPTGVANLRNTSTALRQQVLPPLQAKIVGLRAAESEPALARAASGPWVLLVTGSAVLAVLLGLQWQLAARSRRRLNAGLLVATVALVGSTALAWAALDRTASAAGEDGAAVLLRDVDDAAASALEARLAADDEIVWFSENGTGSAGVDAGRRFEAELSKIENRGTGAPADVRALVAGWRESHLRLVEALDAPDPLGAARSSILGPGPGSAASFRGLADTLDGRVERARAEAFTALLDARSPLGGTVVLLVVGGVVVLGGAWLGLRARMGDYR